MTRSLLHVIMLLGAMQFCGLSLFLICGTMAEVSDDANTNTKFAFISVVDGYNVTHISLGVYIEINVCIILFGRLRALYL